MDNPLYEQSFVGAQDSRAPSRQDQSSQEPRINSTYLRESVQPICGMIESRFYVRPSWSSWYLPLEMIWSESIHTSQLRVNTST
jgi:hypothetical protein